MVDTGVAGHLGSPIFLGAVVLGANLLSLLYFLFGFLRMVTGGLAAQAFGADDMHSMSALLPRALAMAVLLGLLVIALIGVIEPIAARIFGIDGPLQAAFAEYIYIRVWGAPAALATFVLIGWTLGHQNSIVALWILLTTNGINAALDFVFVLGFGMGVDGIALATVAADYCGLVLGLVLVRRIWRQSGCRFLSWRELLDAAELLKLTIHNRDFFFRSLCLEAAFLSFMTMSARLGELPLAANAIMFVFFSLSAYGLDGFAQATEAMVGKAIGAKARNDLSEAIRTGFCNGGLLSIGMTVMFVIGSWPIICLLTDLSDVRASAADLQIYIWLMPLVSVWAFILDGVFFGATRTRDLRNGMFLALLLFLAGCALLVPPLGNHGLWIMMLSFLAARGIILAVIWRRIGPKIIQLPIADS